MTPNNNESRYHGWLSPVVHLCNNWLSQAGVIVVTTATVFWLFLLPVTLGGETQNPYIGILAFLGIPALFFLGLIVIPLGMWLKSRREHRDRLYPPNFPPPRWNNPELRKLVYFLLFTTCANIVIASQLSYGAVNYMDSVTFCGKTCHTVMQPEYEAYVNSPHSSVECVKCHIGPGAASFVEMKLAGVQQLFAVTFHTYPKPIPAPVHNMRPARDTCEGCHWPQRSLGERLRVIPKFAEDETNSETDSVLLMKIGGAASGTGIHGAHLGSGVAIRYGYSDPARQSIPWVEYGKNGRTTVYAAADAKPDGAGLTMRQMDCLDCHNRPAHTFDLPERALDRAMADGRISTALPFAKKAALGILKTAYPSREEAAQRIPADFARYYQQSYPAAWNGRQSEVTASAQAILAIYNRNIFPEMNVTWGKYPVNIGHNDFPGCFRCHDGSHNAKDGTSIGQDCTACHNLVAMDEKNPKVLTDLGFFTKGEPATK